MTSLSEVLNSFVQTLINKGVQNVVVSPGSRNFPLIKSFIAAEKYLTCHSVTDERSAGFVGLGLAQSTKKPVVLCCTSGTASLNYYPAIAEAYYANIPLIVITADRPPHSIDNWEGQSIRQENVFTNHILKSFKTPHEEFDLNHFKLIADEAARLASREEGPVHINMPFNEPFYDHWKQQSYKRPSSEVAEKKEFLASTNLIQEDIKQANKILWLNGADRSLSDYSYPENLVVLSDVISNKNQTIPHWESILGAIDHTNENYQPDLIISTGTYFVSKKLRQFLQQAKGAKHWHLGSPKGQPDPFHTKPNFLSVKVNAILNLIQQNYAQKDYIKTWEAAKHRVKTHYENLNWKLFNEFTVSKYVHDQITPGAVLQISNSMPIRYMDYLDRSEDLLFLANRGTSGIDGCSSTAVGYSFGTYKDVYLITGDIAFFYDINAFWQHKLPDNLKIILLNNSGGGIFELINGPTNHLDSLPWQTTDHKRNAKAIAEHFGIDYYQASDFNSLRSCWNDFNTKKSISILEVQTDRENNKEFMRLFNTFKL